MRVAGLLVLTLPLAGHASPPPTPCAGGRLTVALTVQASDPAPQGVTLELTYPPAEVSLPGSADELRARVSDQRGAALVLEVADGDANGDGKDDRLRMVYAAKSPIGSGPLVHVALDCVATAVTLSHLGCAVREAAGGSGKPLDGVRCAVAVP